MNPSYNLHYQIEPSPHGVVLHIWETLDENDEARVRRGSPFLFRINYRVPGIDEAYRLLQEYLEFLGSTELQELVMDETRSIIVNPLATESFMNRIPT
ncbi:MAG: hypothetical protein ACOYME_14025 [Prochlorotrichaceae cyanobacterium]|jgi:hypothetical protein